MNVTGEAIADIALGDDYYPGALARARETGQRNLDLIDQFLAGHDSLSWHRPEAGLIGFCALHLDLDAEQFSRKLIAAPYRTFVMPGSAYGHPHHLRLGAGGSTARLQDGLDRLALFMATLD
jgi:aspartate/methionine/tyrosine aminotransferase